jgi:hypothetical protein
MTGLRKGHPSWTAEPAWGQPQGHSDLGQKLSENLGIFKSLVLLDSQHSCLPLSLGQSDNRTQARHRNVVTMTVKFLKKAIEFQ